MSLVDFTRRLGERHGAHGVVLDWNTRGRRRPGTLRRRYDDADVIDVSVTGAQLLAPRSDKLRPGDLITVAAGGALGSVRIVRVAPVSNARLCIFGVEFIELEPALEALIHSQIAGDRPARLEVVWSTST